MSDIVVPEYLPAPFLERLGVEHDVLYDPDLYLRRSELLGSLARARAVLIRNRTLIDTELLEAAPDLTVVGRLGVGLDNIDLLATDKAGVEVIPAPGANAVSVAEYVMGAMLILNRGVFSMTESMVRGEWPRQGHAFGNELAGKTLGLIGFGSIGRHVAARAHGFAMTVVAHDPNVRNDDDVWGVVRRVTLEEVLGASDVISLHVPLDESTRNLIDAAAISRMKENVILINTSRGGIVDEPALAEALRAGRVRGAALDVFANEPLGSRDAEPFAGLSNILLTPHVAGNTRESVDRIAGVIVEAVLERLDGD